MPCVGVNLVLAFVLRMLQTTVQVQVQVLVQILVPVQVQVQVQVLVLILALALALALVLVLVRALVLALVVVLVVLVLVLMPVTVSLHLPRRPGYRVTQPAAHLQEKSGCSPVRRRWVMPHTSRKLHPRPAQTSVPTPRRTWSRH